MYHGAIVEQGATAFAISIVTDLKKGDLEIYKEAVGFNIMRYTAMWWIVMQQFGMIRSRGRQGETTTMGHNIKDMEGKKGTQWGKLKKNIRKKEQREETETSTYAGDNDEGKKEGESREKTKVRSEKASRWETGEKTSLIRRKGFTAEEATRGHRMRRGNNAIVRAEELGDSAEASQRKV